MEKVSVVISTRNRAHVLPTAIESALAQTYSNIEIIVADDESSDNTRQLVAEYAQKDSRIKYFRQIDRLGIAPTWKKAFFEYSTGDLITVLNDDDEFLDNDFVAQAVELFEKHQDDNVVCVFSNVVYKIEKINAKDIAYPNGFDEFLDGKSLFDGETFIFTDNGSIYKKEALNKLELFNEDITSLDLEMLYKLMLVGNFCYLDSVTYQHNFDDQCISFYTMENIVRNFEASRWIKIVADFANKLGMDVAFVREWQRKKYKTTLDGLHYHYGLEAFNIDYSKYIESIPDLLPTNTKVVIYGTAEAGRTAMTNILLKRKDVDIVCFLDDIKSGDFYGIPILSLEQVDENITILIPSGNPRSVRAMLEKIYAGGKKNKIIDILGV